MFASNLARLLFNLMDRADMSHPIGPDMLKRIDSLRQYRRLPPGRENHSTRLTDEHIANAILGLVVENPGWAGLGSKVLAGLRPVGGVEASFRKAKSLSEAIQILIADEEARAELVSLSISGAEFAINSNGSAQLTYTHDGQMRTAFYVSDMAVSLMQPGAEVGFSQHPLYAPMSRQTVFNRKFFEKIARDVEISRQLADLRPASDGSEYDAEEAEQRRREKLGVRPGSNYLTLGVDNQVTWPQEETLVTFDGYTMVLMPKTKEHMQSISIDLTANRLSMEDARTVVNRFLSIMTWCCDQFAIVQDGWAGSPIPQPVSRRDLAFSTAPYWVFDRKIPKEPNTQRALALFREARNAEQNGLVSYAVLNYYKIIELLGAERNAPRRWIKAAYPDVEKELPPHVLKAFDEERGQETPEAHIYKAYRLAVAHAGAKSESQTISDPDKADELKRLHLGAEVLHLLARRFIETELKVSDSMYSGD